MSKKELYKDGLERYPASRIILTNVIMLALFFTGAYLCSLFHPIAGIVYIVTVLLVIYILMRKLVCTNCWYYGKWCGSGWGKLAALMFKQGEIEKFPGCTGVNIAPMVYGLASLIPLAIGILVFILHPTLRIQASISIVLLVGFSFYSSVAGRKKQCSVCKMRFICPGGNIAN